MVYSAPGDSTSDKGGKSGTLIYSAIVIDFISNPGAENFTSKFELYKDTENEEEFIENNKLLDRVPRNAIIGRLITDGKGKSTSNRIFFPFFPPYFSLPVKPGEQVWVIFESLNDTAGVGYWMARKHADLNVDDLNYTHLDRMNPLRTQQSDGALPGARDTFEGVGDVDYFDFPPGGGLSPANNTLEDPEGYEKIYTTATSIDQFVGEAIPRFTKRSPDLALQGSNNTLICLGTDRSAGADLATTQEGAGTIDIVCGRGRVGDTAPLVAVNTRELNEVNKVPLQSQKGEPNLTEGDPDFLWDSSRIYVSMLTDGDANFGITYSHDDATLIPGAPYVIAKSNEIRLVARVGGSVRLVKEQDFVSGGAEISLLGNATIAMDGTKIYLGNNKQASIADAAGITVPATVEGQKVVRGNDLHIAITTFADAIAAALGTGAAVGNLGAPLLSAADITAACTKLTTDVESSLSPSVFVK